MELAPAITGMLLTRKTGMRAISIATPACGLVGTICGAYFGLKTGTDDTHAAVARLHAKTAKAQAFAVKLLACRKGRRLIVSKHRHFAAPQVGTRKWLLRLMTALAAVSAVAIAVSAAVDAAVVTGTITPDGNQVSVTISNAGDTAALTFDETADHSIFLAFGSGFSYYSKVRIYNPDGTLLVQADFGNVGCREMAAPKHQRPVG